LARAEEAMAAVLRVVSETTRLVELRALLGLL
jgi:hypothetical protein